MSQQPEPDRAAAPWARALAALRADAASRLGRDSLLVFCASALGRALALCKEMLTAAFFGVGGAMDAYVLALLVPSFAANLLGSAFATALIPALGRAAASQGEPAARRLLRSALGAQLLFLGLTALILALLPLLTGGAALRLIAPAAGPELLERIRTMQLALLPLFILGSLGQTLAAVVNWRGGFRGPALATSLNALCALGSLAALQGLMGPYALAVGAGAGAGLELCLLLWLARRIWGGGATAMRAAGGDGLLRPLLRDWGLLALGMALLGATAFVEGAIASTLGEGAVSALNYAVKLPSGFSALLGLTLATVLLPHFTNKAQRATPDELRASCRRVVSRVLLVSVPLALAGALCSSPLVELLFRRGRFDAGAATLVATLQAWYFLQLPLTLLGVASTRLLQAQGRLRGLLWLQAGVLAGDAVLCLLFALALGPEGIAMAAVCVAAGSAATSLWMAARPVVGQSPSAQGPGPDASGGPA